MTAYASVETAVQALKDGAYDYIVKPFEPEVVSRLVRKASERYRLLAENRELKRQVEAATPTLLSAGAGAMKLVFEAAEQVAPTDTSVLIRGESGTGKELVARLIHSRSPRRFGPLSVVNCGALSEGVLESELFGHEKGAFTGAMRQQIGKFELAHGGTLFLDEIGDLKFDLQAKLLRAIQEGEIERVGGGKPIKVQFRLIAATNVDLERAVREGAFREDLYYRINVIPIRIPPLRERIEDLPDLVQFFLTRYNTRFRKNVQGFASSTLTMLQNYWWPGNIRELENLVERLVATCSHDWITDGDLPFELQVADIDRADQSAHLLDRALSTFERNFIIRALERSRWNVTQTARYLGIPLSTLKFKLDRLEIKDIARKIRGSA
jgi:DNA-binding NtrC family response regulator